VRRSEAYLSEAQHLSHTGSFGCKPASEEMFWSEETFRIFQYDRATKPAVDAILQRVHPEDKALVQERIDRAINESKDCDMEYRLLLPDNSIKHVHVVAHAVKDDPGGFDFVGAVMDVTEHRQATAQLQRAFEEIRALKDRLYQENIALRDEVDRTSMFEEIVGTSRALKAVLSRIAKVAPTDSTVLITGETGTGKELIARAVHNLSRRRSRPFVKLNCAAIPTGLLESELFGHEKGAFTGAIAQRMGRFEVASQGTIFLDEISEIPLDLQPKLLRVLQEREFERLGSSRTIRTDARLIAATNRDLNAMVEEQRFRSDLFYRLNVFPLHVPPLRERNEDIPSLVRHFAQHFARNMAKNIDTIPGETMNALVRYPWPGNIRELQNVIERAVILSKGPVLKISSADLEPKGHGTNGHTNGNHINGAATLEEIERKHILSVLEQTNWVLAGPEGAAAKLGMKRPTLQFRMQKLGISRPQRPPAGVAKN